MPREPAKSLPAPGSLKSWHHSSSPVNIGRSNRSRCSGVPWVAMVGPARWMKNSTGSRGVRPAAGESAFHWSLELGADAQPAVSLFEVHPGESGVVLVSAELPGGFRGWIVLRQQLVDGLGHPSALRIVRKGRGRAVGGLWLRVCGCGVPCP